MADIDPQKLIDSDKADDQFGVAKVPYHVHNGTDSQRIDANSLEFSRPYFRLFVATTTPTASIPGAIASVNGKLMIHDGSNWVIVGTQT